MRTIEIMELDDVDYVTLDDLHAQERDYVGKICELEAELEKEMEKFRLLHTYTGEYAKERFNETWEARERKKERE